MDYLKYAKHYGGYILAVGAGCYFGVNNLIALALLAGTAYLAYKYSCKCSCNCSS